MVRHLHIQLHHLVHVEGLHASGDCRAQRVADEVQRMMVRDERGVPGDDLTLGRLLHIVLDADETFLARLAEDLKEELQRVEIAGLVERRRLQNADDAGGHCLDCLNRVGDKDGAQRRAANGDEFGGLDEDGEMSVLHQEAADDGAEDDKDSKDGKHGE